MNAPIAILDLGTNTFHLLIAEYSPNTYRIVYRDKQAVRLGKGGIQHKAITEEAQQRAIATLVYFNTIMQTYAVSEVKAFGTSAIRNAANQQAFVDRILQETGIPISVINGDEEASLIFDGIRYALSLGKEKCLVVDIGGGSVEFIIGNSETVFWKRSIEIGGQRLMDMFQHHDPILPEEMEQMNHFFDDSLQELVHQIHEHQPEVFIGSSGSFDTLSDIHCLRHNLQQHEDDPEKTLTFDGFRSIYYELITKNHEERLRIPGMIELRVDMIVVASCLIRYLFERHTFRQLRVSGYSLKEGALYRIIRQR
jgi:exopolyphosphatase / guanosine-5'-triphosphate,3'-diphosphate pyrophosphatase